MWRALQMPKTSKWKARQFLASNCFRRCLSHIHMPQGKILHMKRWTPPSQKKTKKTTSQRQFLKVKKWEHMFCPSGNELWSSFLSSSLCSCTDLLWYVVLQYSTTKPLYPPHNQERHSKRQKWKNKTEKLNASRGNAAPYVPGDIGLDWLPSDQPNDST